MLVFNISLLYNRCTSVGLFGQTFMLVSYVFGQRILRNSLMRDNFIWQIRSYLTSVQVSPSGWTFSGPKEKWTLASNKSHPTHQSASPKIQEASKAFLTKHWSQHLSSFSCCTLDDSLLTFINTSWVILGQIELSKYFPSTTRQPLNLRDLIK